MRKGDTVFITYHGHVYRATYLRMWDHYYTLVDLDGCECLVLNDKIFNNEQEALIRLARNA